MVQKVFWHLSANVVLWHSTDNFVPLISFSRLTAICEAVHTLVKPKWMMQIATLTFLDLSCLWCFDRSGNRVLRWRPIHVKKSCSSGTNTEKVFQAFVFLVQYKLETLNTNELQENHRNFTSINNVLIRHWERLQFTSSLAYICIFKIMMVMFGFMI